MISIPKKAWPGLVHFAPEKFPTLLAQYDSLEPGSKERQLVGAELECLIAEFRRWAVTFRRLQRDAKLQLLAERVQREEKLDEEFWAKHFDALAAADLTPAEDERLARQIVKRTDRIVKPMEAALDALEKPGRYRDRKIS